MYHSVDFVSAYIIQIKGSQDFKHNYYGSAS